MSASLVGSEMCIRDSALAARGPDAVGAPCSSPHAVAHRGSSPERAWRGDDRPPNALLAVLEEVRPGGGLEW
eukprot:5198136-Alexandrium_andersonii.AAC.1